MAHLGIRHVALNVQNPQKSKAFYMEVLSMRVEWEPDPDNIYLTTLDPRQRAQDNLAIHKAEAQPSGPQKLDHFGVILSTLEELHREYERIQGLEVRIVKPLKKHRDGASSFYIEDPDGICIQFLHHPPISDS